MGSGLSASTVTRAIGDSWIVVCDRAYRASYTEAPAIAPEAFAEQFNAELDARMSKPLRLWRNVATKAADDKAADDRAADEERGKP